MKNILILDTETALNIEQPLIYDLGFVALVNGKVVKENYLIKEVFDTYALMKSAYYVKKRPKYYALRNNGKIQPITFQKAIRLLIKFIRDNKIEVISAYNVAFDIRAIENTLRILDTELYEKGTFQKLIKQKNKKILCLWNLACDNILNTDEFRKFADNHNMKTPKGNYQTNAEVAYAFITNQPEFKEEHLALSDSEIELAIFLKVLELENPKIEFGKKGNCWRKVQVKT
jgi:hypothetical protein